MIRVKQYYMPLVIGALIVSMHGLVATSDITVKKQDNTVDLVVFSYDRALQLYSFLESLEKHATGLHKVFIVYRSSNDDHTQSYEIVKKRFPAMTYCQQGPPSAKDFKPLVLQAFGQDLANYLTFAVDDDIIKEKIDFTHCTRLLEQTGAYGFYLRMGLHLTHCYSLRGPQRVRSYTQVHPGVYSWRFCDGTGDWGYPGSVELTVWRKSDLEQMLTKHPFNNPNKLEDVLNYYADKKKSGLCFASSSVVNLPLNIVNETQQSNNQMNWMTPNQLLAKFRDGYKIDIDKLYKVKNRACHMDYQPSFIVRDDI